MGYEVVDAGIRLYVRDTGIGIPEEKKRKVFHRFEKLDEFAQGTGLGLSICKAITESMGGSVGFESEYSGDLFSGLFYLAIRRYKCVGSPISPLDRMRVKMI